MAPTPAPITHGDLMERLGGLSAQVKILIDLVAQKREEIQNIYCRVSELERTTATRIDLADATATTRTDLADAERRIFVIEKEIAKWIGICIAISFTVPLTVPFIIKEADSGADRLERSIRPEGSVNNGSPNRER